MPPLSERLRPLFLRFFFDPSFDMRPTSSFTREYMFSAMPASRLACCCFCNCAGWLHDASSSGPENAAEGSKTESFSADRGSVAPDAAAAFAMHCITAFTAEFVTLIGLPLELLLLRCFLWQCRSRRDMPSHPRSPSVPSAAVS